MLQHYNNTVDLNMFASIMLATAENEVILTKSKLFYNTNKTNTLWE